MLYLMLLHSDSKERILIYDADGPVEFSSEWRKYLLKNGCEEDTAIGALLTEKHRENGSSYTLLIGVHLTKKL